MKLVIWVIYPGEVTLVTKALIKIGIDATCLYGFMDQKERDQTIQVFQASESKNQAMTLTYSMGQYDLNFQFKCHYSLHLDIAPSEAAGEQSMCRTRRCGQFRPVIADSVHVPGTFMDQQKQLNIRKRLPGAFTELNERLTYDGNEEAKENRIILGRWVKHNGKLARAEDVVSDEA